MKRTTTLYKEFLPANKINSTVDAELYSHLIKLVNLNTYTFNGTENAVLLQQLILIEQKKFHFSVLSPEMIVKILRLDIKSLLTKAMKLNLDSTRIEILQSLHLKVNEASSSNDFNLILNQFKNIIS